MAYTTGGPMADLMSAPVLDTSALPRAQVEQVLVALGTRRDGLDEAEARARLVRRRKRWA